MMDIKAFPKAEHCNRIENIKGNFYYNQNKLMADGYTNYTTSGAYSGKMYDTDEKNRTYGADIQKKWEFGNKANLILGSSYQNEFYDDYGKDGHKSPDQVTSRNMFMGNMTTNLMKKMNLFLGHVKHGLLVGIKTRIMIILVCLVSICIN